jgi:hypothetical protein
MTQDHSNGDRAARRAWLGPKVSRKSIGVEHVRIDTSKPYDRVRDALDQLPRFDEGIRRLLQEGRIDDVRAALTGLQGEAGLTIFSVATHGDWLQILSQRRNALQYVIGNVLISTQMTQYALAAGLYAPLRIILYENAAGGSTFEYDRPSTLFGQFYDERITPVAEALDQKVHDVLLKAAI